LGIDKSNFKARKSLPKNYKNVTSVDSAYLGVNLDNRPGKQKAKDTIILSLKTVCYCSVVVGVSQKR